MVKKMFTVLLMTGAIAGFTPAAQASHGAERGGLRDSDQEQKSIVGSWMGTLENGERLLMSFTSDGINFSSVQGEVKLTGPVLTPAHGAWARVGRRQFAITNVVVLYDIQTGEYLGSGKLRAVVTLDKTGDRMSGTATIDIFAPDGTPAIAFSHTLRFTRIEVEPLD
jgi:hypothetical protein